MEKQLGWTTIEQSEKLIEAGLNPNTADMFYIFDPFVQDIAGLGIGKPEETGDIPCWSLGSLIELMPFNPTINGIKVFFQLNQIGCRYTYRDDNLSIREVVVFTNSNLIDNVVSMVCWLLENNHIKKGETK